MKSCGGLDVKNHIFLTSAPAGGEWSASRPGRLTPGKEPSVPIRYEAGWVPEPVSTTWRRENSWPYRDSNSDPSVFQPVASRYTDWAIPALSRILMDFFDCWRDIKILCNTSSSIYIYMAVNVNKWKIYENNKLKCTVINKGKVVSKLN
jgi:hypothetical protein